MSRDWSPRSALKSLRAWPVLNVPLTHAVRGATRALRRESEFAIKHLPHSGVTTARLPNGARLKLWSRGDDWVSNQVFWRGWDGYDPELAPLFWRLAVNSAVTVDVGAYVGYYTILAGLANPGGRVLAFEPLPAAYERLGRHLRLNRLANVVALQQAAGSLEGTDDFFHVDGLPTSSSLSASFMGAVKDVRSTQVAVRRVENVARELGIERVDLVKLDTETTEPDVLRGMGRLLSEDRPDIICEVLDRADVDSLTDILSPLGYRFFLLTDGGPQEREVLESDPRWLNYLFTASARRPS